MHYQSFVLLAVTISSVSAVPSRMAKREQVWDPNGNIKITFSDEKISLGTITVGSITDKLNVVCSTQGQCDTSPLQFSGQQVEAGMDGSVEDITVTVNPSGAYPTWIHNGLVDNLYAAVMAVAQCKDVTNTPTCPNPAAYCPLKPFTVHECVVPQYWGVNFQAPDATDAAPPFIGADMSVKVEGLGFCADMFTAIGAIAGAVHGVAGGFFTLLSLACK